MTEKMILIMGCTACGKGKLAFELARRVGGHILSVDSMKVYLEKPTRSTFKVLQAKPWSLTLYGLRHVNRYNPLSTMIMPVAAMR